MDSLKKWAEDNNLDYSKIGGLTFSEMFLIKENVKKCVWGELNGKRIYVFTTFYIDFVPFINFSYPKYNIFINNNFYSNIKPEDIGNILGNKNYKNFQTLSILDRPRKIIIYALIANVYIKTGKLINTENMQSVFKLLPKKINKVDENLMENIANQLKGNSISLEDNFLREILNSYLELFEDKKQKIELYKEKNKSSIAIQNIFLKIFLVLLIFIILSLFILLLLTKI
jgi:hypothetical protein